MPAEGLIIPDWKNDLARFQLEAACVETDFVGRVVGVRRIYRRARFVGCLGGRMI